MASGTGCGTLVGRAGECERIDGLIEGARLGRGAALLLRGDPGIGKTVLLHYAARNAMDFTILWARGIESESEISFSGLSELLRPLLDRIGTLPPRQAEALESALAIGPPVSGDRFAVAAATLTLLAAAASDRPVLVLVDDLQWLDTSSAEALLFAARRLENEPTCLLFAARDEPANLPPLGIPEHRVVGLDREASLALLASHANIPVATNVAERLFLETGGNPLALVELPTLVSDDQLAGRERLLGPAPVGERIETAFADRIAALPDSGRTALLVAAAADTRSTELVVRSLRELGLHSEALEPAERAGLVTMDVVRFEFRHPLARSAAYYRAAAAERRAAHAALARSLAGSTGELAERRAWHLAAATLEPDEDVAAALDEAATNARSRSGYSAAALAFERAAQVSPDPAARPARMYAAASCWQLANRPDRAVALLAAAEPLASNASMRASILHLQARIDTWRGPALDAHRRLRDEAESLVATAPGTSAAMLSDAVLAAITGGNLALGLEAGHRASEVAKGVGGPVELIASLQLGKVLILTGSAGAGRPLIMRCVELFDGIASLEYANELAQCAPALMAIEEYDLTYRLLSTVVGAARAANALGLLGYSLGALSELETRTGRWPSASADGVEAINLAREAGQDGQLSYNLARLARLEAAQGRADECRAHVAEAVEVATRYSFGSTFPFAESALGLLELGLGNPTAAIPHLEETGRHWEAMGFREPGRLEWQGDLIEAYVRSGRRPEARSALAELAASAEKLNKAAPFKVLGSLVRAQVERCRGLLAEDHDVDRAFETALKWHESTPTPFEEARTRLCYGELLRRQGRRVDARRELRASLETFTRLGAGPWVLAARNELAATGEKVRPAARGPVEELTSQELQVALIVARGATNKEAGAALFLTPKTVEFHLAKIYRKLNLRSRTELARRFLDAAAPSTAGTGERIAVGGVH